MGERVVNWVGTETSRFRLMSTASKIFDGNDRERSDTLCAATEGVIWPVLVSETA